MPTKSEPASIDRALVLGGGGPVGIAWEAGVVAGLASEGVDLNVADQVIGTSAGSFVGAHVAAGRPADALYQAQIMLGQKDAAERASGKLASAERMPKPDLTPLMALFLKPLAHGETAQDRRREMGRLALDTPTLDETAYLAGFGRTLSELQWPETFVCTAVDAETGALELWRHQSGVSLVRGVGSSCSVPGIFPPVTIQGRRYVDGGVRSATCIDIAKGARRVIALAVVGRMGRDFQMDRIEPELDALKPEGEAVLITPDEASLDTFGLNLMAAEDRAGIARAGYAQGRSEAKRVAKLWA